MLPHPPVLVRCSPIAPVVLALWSLSLSACVQFETSTCPSGLVCPTGMRCAARQDVCIPASPSCGDGIVQDGERCDDGNVKSGDGCNSTCTSDESCGNHIVDPGEACDDGNNENNDLCSADCKHSAVCGNGNVDALEECDDKNESDSDDCLKTCVRASCGDGFVNREGAHPEECDPKAGQGPCTLDCKLPRCGDGIVTPEAQEECDPPGPHGNFTCTDQCQIAFCGNGRIDPGEECDNGSANGASSCLSNCKQNTCGDGIVAAGEVCDEGPANGARTCRYGEQSCKVCNWDCKSFTMLQGSYCGDGKVDSSVETCDLGESCGACVQCIRKDPKKATARITVADTGPLNNGDVLVIGDGSKLPVTFIFSNRCDYTCTLNNNQPLCCVDGDNSAKAVAASLKTAIRAAKAEGLFGITITSTNNSSTVELELDAAGAFGNQNINTTKPKAFELEGFSGGIGFTCPKGSRCDSNADCVPPLTCDSNGFCNPR